MSKSFKALEQQRRVEAANEFIKVIASCGRNFLSSNSDKRSNKVADPFVSFMELDKNGKIWFTDYYTRKRIYTQYRYDWRGFTSGGTLRSIVCGLRDFIRDGSQLRGGYFNYDESAVFHNPWGYGEDILIVKEAALRLGVAV